MQMAAMTEVEGHAAPLTSAAGNNNATLDAGKGGKKQQKTKKNPPPVHFHGRQPTHSHNVRL